MASKVKPAKATGRGRTRLSRKNQATIPVAVLRAAGLEPGDVLEVEAVARGEIKLRRAQGRFEKYSVPEGTYPPGYLAELRAEWDR